MRINELQQSNTVASGNVFAIDTDNGTFKIDYDVLAAAIINQLGGDPVTIAHGGTGATSAAAAKGNLGLGTATNNVRFTNPTTASHQIVLRFVVTNSNSTYKDKELLFIIRSNGISLFNNTDNTTIWTINS